MVLAFQSHCALRDTKLDFQLDALGNYVRFLKVCEL